MPDALARIGDAEKGNGQSGDDVPPVGSLKALEALIMIDDRTVYRLLDHIACQALAAGS